MADFNAAVDLLLTNEGGLFRDPNASLTNYGITKNTYSEYLKREVTEDEMINMSKDKAKEFYKKAFWDKYSFGIIQSQKVATCLLDTFVNLGPHRAGRFAQEASGIDLVDGKFGTNSLNAVMACNEVVFIKLFYAAIKDYYTELCLEHDQFKPFLKGWISRADKMRNS